MKSKMTFKPRTITINPAATFIIPEKFPNRKKIEFIRRPMTIKTALKPRTKPEAGIIKRDLKPAGFTSLFRPTPAIMPKYEGTSGSMQGEKKDTSPAEKTINTEMLPFIIIPAYASFYICIQSEKTRCYEFRNSCPTSDN